MVLIPDFTPFLTCAIPRPEVNVERDSGLAEMINSGSCGREKSSWAEIIRKAQRAQKLT